MEGYAADKLTGRDARHPTLTAWSEYAVTHFRLIHVGQAFTLLKGYVT